MPLDLQSFSTRLYLRVVYIAFHTSYMYTQQIKHWRLLIRIEKVSPLRSILAGTKDQARTGQIYIFLHMCHRKKERTWGMLAKISRTLPQRCSLWLIGWRIFTFLVRNILLLQHCTHVLHSRYSHAQWYNRDLHVLIIQTMYMTV